MKILLPKEIKDKLTTALKKAGKNEIGGVLMGEHLSEGVFKVANISIQAKSGGTSHFIRMLSDAIRALKFFFKSTGNNYKKFNYLGEWHSHPSFEPIPSMKDVQSAISIVTDQSIGANFIVLLIIRLDRLDNIEASATAFFPNLCYINCELIIENDS